MKEGEVAKTPGFKLPAKYIMNGFLDREIVLPYNRKVRAMNEYIRKNGPFNYQKCNEIGG